MQSPHNQSVTELSDRDILVILHERTGVIRSDLTELKADVKDQDKRIRVLEDKGNQATGFLAGANWVKGVVLALPVGLVGWFLNQHR